VRVLSVDPGTFGAIAVIDTERPTQVAVHRFPNAKIATGDKSATRLDLDACWSLLSSLDLTYGPELCFFEDVNGYSGNEFSTGASGFVFGRATGVIEAYVVTLRISRRYIPPTEWKKAYGLTFPKKTPKAERKTAARMKAKQLFPAQSFEFDRVKDDGPAEAALIGLYGASKCIGVKPA
jgi:crossover junction endodeoxyribonuclease RuvC